MRSIIFALIAACAFGCGRDDGATEMRKQPPPTVKPKVPSESEQAILVVAAVLPPNPLNVSADDLRALDNPKGAGVFVYVPQTRFDGVERYIVWMVVSWRLYPLNGATKNLTPDQPWPREAPAAVWSKTNLNPHTAAQTAIELLF